MKASEIRTRLQSSDRLVERALVVLYERQTADEQASDETTHDNGVGFNALDAGFLSSLARQVIENRYGRDLGARLTPRQRECARRAVLKYAGQLAAAAAAKEAARARPAPAPCRCEETDGEECPVHARHEDGREEREMQRIEAEGRAQAATVNAAEVAREQAARPDGGRGLTAEAARAALAGVAPYVRCRCGGWRLVADRECGRCQRAARDEVRAAQAALAL